MMKADGGIKMSVVAGSSTYAGPRTKAAGARHGGDHHPADGWWRRPGRTKIPPRTSPPQSLPAAACLGPPTVMANRKLTSLMLPGRISSPPARTCGDGQQRVLAQPGKVLRHSQQNRKSNLTVGGWLVMAAAPAKPSAATDRSRAANHGDEDQKQGGKGNHAERPRR
jgi:hypothetical protein